MAHVKSMEIVVEGLGVWMGMVRDVDERKGGEVVGSLVYRISRDKHHHSYSKSICTPNPLGRMCSTINAPAPESIMPSRTYLASANSLSVT
jgi:hypothetical protein